MKEFDIIDSITIAMILMPVIVASVLARLYVKEKDELEQYGSHLSKELSMDEKFVMENLSNSSLWIKILACYVFLGAVAFQAYELNQLYVWIVPVVSIIVVFGFYGRKTGIDENDAALVVVRLLGKISEANRIGNNEKAKNLALLCDYTIAKFQLIKSGEAFESKKHITYADTLTGNERTIYVGKSIVTKLYFSLKILVPIVIAVAIAILIKAAI
jgi:hypothetical protein